MKKLFLLLLISLSTFAQKSIPFGNNPQAGHYATIRGFQMYYEIYGKGEPLLFIHGNNGSIQDFKNQIPTFSKRYRVIIADNRSQGKSIDTQDSLSYEQMADDFAALLDHLKLDSVHVVGWSDGGINGLLLASRHPEKVRKLAVTGANLTPEPVKSTDAWVVENEYHVIDSLSKLPVNAESKRQLKLHRLLVNEPHISHAELNKIQCPTLVIGGDHDVIMPRHTLEIAEAIPRSYLWILPNSGHSTPVFYKTLFNSTVLDFLRTPYRKIEKEAKFFYMKKTLLLLFVCFFAHAQKRNLTLSLMPDSYAVCRLAPNSKVPDWAYQGSFYSISKTSDELSIVVDQRYAPAGIKKAENWKGFKIEGPLDFSITGILAALSKTLADNKIPLFCVSTYDTDYILVESKYYEQAKKVLAIENTIK